MNKYQEEYNLIEKLVGDKIYFSNHANFEEVKEVTKALNSLQKALKKANKYDDKETPKKYKIKTDKDGRMIFVCPNCNNTLVKFWSEVETIRCIPYCENCGQKLDWSDE